MAMQVLRFGRFLGTRMDRQHALPVFPGKQTLEAYDLNLTRVVDLKHEAVRPRDELARRANNTPPSLGRGLPTIPSGSAANFGPRSQEWGCADLVGPNS